MMDKSFSSSFNNISSASPNIVTRIINEHGVLEKKTSVVVIDTEKGEIQVYRDSSSKKGFSSLDIYDTSTKKFLRKDKKKFQHPPLVPSGAFQYEVQGIQFSTITQRTEEELTILVKELGL